MVLYAEYVHVVEFLVQLLINLNEVLNLVPCPGLCLWPLFYMTIKLAFRNSFSFIVLNIEIPALILLLFLLFSNLNLVFSCAVWACAERNPSCLTGLEQRNTGTTLEVVSLNSDRGTYFSWRAKCNRISVLFFRYICNEFHSCVISDRKTYRM